MINIKEKKILKENLIKILNKFDKITVNKIHLTLKENNIWPNINMFFEKKGFLWSERIFLTDVPCEYHEQELFDKLAKCKTIRDLMNINQRLKFELQAVSKNINY